MQAALMAQALARGQMQAQAAMMMNPRAMANNLQIMAEHMGLRPPPPPNQQNNLSQNNKPLPTPMLPSMDNGEYDTAALLFLNLVIGLFVCLSVLSEIAM